MTHSHLDALSRVAPILGESAIIDKETGQVFWQGGKQSLFDSTVGHSYLSSQQEGVLQHIRSTLLSCILWTTFIRFIAEWALSQKIFISNVTSRIHKSQRVLDFLRQFTRVLLLCLACLPKFGKEFLIIVMVLYVLEAYHCSTRKYLRNTISCPGEVESFMEGLCEQEPIVTWKIRCYHYEKRKWLCMLLLVDAWNYFSSVAVSLFAKNNHDDEIRDDGTNASPSQHKNKEQSPLLRQSIFTRKVITHQSKQNYKIGHWHDDTISGIWKQAQAATTVLTAFTKISIYKLLLFENKQARVDYFKQQSDFIGREGIKDNFAEFSTHVDVPGYKDKVLAVRPARGIQKLFNIHFFWFFTIMGLTVPYRIHFGKHCDELRVAVIKEVSSRIKTESDSSKSTTAKPSWFASPRSWLWGPATTQDLIQQRRENFRLKMQEMSLYKKRKDVLVDDDVVMNALANKTKSKTNDVPHSNSQNTTGAMKMDESSVPIVPSEDVVSDVHVSENDTSNKMDDIP